MIETFVGTTEHSYAKQYIWNLPTSYTKVNSRWAVNLSIKAAITKQHLKENIDDKKI